MRRLICLFLLLLTACSTSNNEPQVLPTRVPRPEEYQILNYGETESGTLMSADEVGLWQFEGVEGERVRIKAVNQGASVRLKLAYGLNVISEMGDEVELTLPFGGIYFLTVYLEAGAGQYDIGIGYTDRPNPNEATPLPPMVGVPTPTPSNTNLGEFIRELTEITETGSVLSDFSPVHVYTLEGKAGDVVNFELYRIAGTLDPVLRLYDADGNLVAMDDNSLGELNARLFNIILLEDGIYSVQVDGKGLYGDYLLTYSNERMPIEIDPIATAEPTSVVPYVTPVMRVAAPDQRLISHQPMMSSIVREGDFQRYSFHAERGQRISLMVSPFEGQEILPQFEIFNPVGEQVSIARSSESPVEGSAALFGLTIEETGVYVVIVTAEENSVGRFLIQYGEGTTVLDEYQGRIESGQTLDSAITTLGVRHVWEISLDPGDIVSIAARPNDVRFDPFLELAKADGTLVYQDDNSGGETAAALDVIEIREPATYLLRVSDASGAITGGYNLEWRYVNIAATATPIPILATILTASARLELGEYGFYSFQGLAGQEVQISVLAYEGTEFDPVAALIDPNGQVIVEADDSENSLNPIFSLSLPEDGTYSIRVNGYLSGGQFDVKVALVLD